MTITQPPLVGDRVFREWHSDLESMPLFGECLMAGHERSVQARRRCEPIKRLDREKLKDIVAQRTPQVIRAGLAEDWKCTSGVIYDGGEWVDNDFGYESSMWATPVAVIDQTTYECWLVEECP